MFKSTETAVNIVKAMISREWKSHIITGASFSGAILQAGLRSMGEEHRVSRTDMKHSELCERILRILHKQRVRIY